MYNGDCHKLIKDIEKETVQLIYFDPPYGVTTKNWDEKLKMEKLWDEFWRILKPNGTIAIHTSIPYTIELINSQQKYFRYWWIWNKSRKTGFLNSKFQPLRNTEEICIFYKNIPKYNPQTTKRLVSKNENEKPLEADGMILHMSKRSSTGYFGVSKRSNGRFRAQYEGKYLGSYKTDVDSAVAVAKAIETSEKQEKKPIEKKSNGKGIYKSYKKAENKEYTEFQPCTLLNFPCTRGYIKPPELCEFIIKTYTDKGDTVLDICMHTGISGIASKNLERKYIGFESCKKYYDQALENMKN